MNENQKQSKRKIGCLGILSIALAAAIGLYLLSALAGSFLIVSDPIQKSSAVVMLSGGGDERLTAASSIFKHRTATYFIITETGEPFSGSAMDVSSRTADKVAELGIKKDYILITRGQSESTLEESKAVLTLAEKRDFKSLIIVTDSFHTRRAKMIFDDTFKTSGIEIQVSPAATEWFTPWNWWLSGDGRTAAFQEYIKLFAYWLGIKEK